MHTWTHRVSRSVTIAAAATLIGLAAVACQAGAQSATSTSPTGYRPVPPAGYQPVPTTTTTTGTNAPAARKLMFPNTDLEVVFTSYDEKNNLVEFQKVTLDPKSPSAHLIPDPSDPAVHELPMATKATVKSIDPNGFPFETCPPTPSCTGDNMMESVLGHIDSFYAHIHVNAADQIDSVDQSAY